MSFIPSYASDETSDGYESSVRDYVSLLKPRVMSLVVFSGACGMLVAPGHMHPLLAFITILCIALGSGASGAINMWYDRDIDAVMKRTKNRPIPAGRINANEALGFGIITAVASVIVMYVATNIVAAAALAAAILFYVFIYTIWLKRRTPQNIVIGGAAGAFPPVIGWAAVTGDITMMPVIMFMIIFLWTPPHFWALALKIQDEYKNAAVPMLPVMVGDKITKYNILGYALILEICTLMSFFIGFSGIVYIGFCLGLNIIFIYLCVRLTLEKGITFAGKTFGFSIMYLFMLFTALVADKYI